MFSLLVGCAGVGYALYDAAGSQEINVDSENLMSMTEMDDVQEGELTEDRLILPRRRWTLNRFNPWKYRLPTWRHRFNKALHPVPH